MHRNELIDTYMICPFCGSPATIRPFGYGYIGICRKCRYIMYNGSDPPMSEEKAVNAELHHEKGRGFEAGEPDTRGNSDSALTG